MTINKGNTLTIQNLIDSANDGRVSKDMPIGVLIANGGVVRGICSFELLTYTDGSVVFVARTESSTRLVTEEEYIGSEEVFGER